MLSCCFFYTTHNNFFTQIYRFHILCVFLLKGTLAWEILPLVFSLKHDPKPPDLCPKAVLNINSNLPRYLKLKPILQCGLFLQGSAGLKPVCYRPWVVLFHHTHIFHRLSLSRQQQDLKEYSNDPAVLLLIAQRGHNIGSDPIKGSDHIRGSNPLGGGATL